ncbi:hypothetical protein MAUB1S_08384 [Mycolicibacterium aubagnense]
MPIENDETLKDLLANEQITALTLDTNVFDGQQLNFKSASLKAVASLQSRPFSFLLPSTVVSEVRGHVRKTMEDALGATRKALGTALAAFDVAKPTRDQLLEQITGGHSVADAAIGQVDEFLESSACEVLNDTSLVDISAVFGAYFDRRPPFGHGKKSEFPDALALHALEQAATDRKTGFLVVFEDSDWRAFCEQSQRLYLVPKVEKALSLINDAPLGLRQVIVAWFADGQEGQVEVKAEISNHVSRLDVDAIAYPTSGEVEIHTWAPELQAIDWPEEADIHIIKTEKFGGQQQLRAVVSLPIVLWLEFTMELSFSIWDGVDKESVDMGGRNIETNRNEDARVTVTLDVWNVGEENEQIELIETELDLTSVEVHLGDVDIFEQEGYDE